MKATGIVRRIEECVIITQKPAKPHEYWGSADFVRIRNGGFDGFFIGIHRTWRGDKRRSEKAGPLEGGLAFLLSYHTQSHACDNFLDKNARV